MVTRVVGSPTVHQGTVTPALWVTVSRVGRLVQTSSVGTRKVPAKGPMSGPLME